MRDEDTDRSSPAQRALSRILLLAGVAAVAWAQWQWTRHRLGAGLPWMLGGILLVVIAAALHDRAGVSATTIPRTRRHRLAEACFLVALTVAGGAARFVALDHLPPGGFFDEVQNHLVAEGILKGDRPIFIAEDTQMPALFFYLLAGAIGIAGKGLTTVRGFSALLGTLTLPVFYLLARRAFAWPVAAATAILLAGSRWHVTFSRVGFTGILGPLLEVLAMLALWKALDTGKLRSYALLGVVVGLGLQSYYSFNLFPAVLVVAVLTRFLRRGGKPFAGELWRTLRGMAVAVGVAAVLLAPLAWFALRHPKTFFHRANTVVIWNPAHHLPWPGALKDNIVTHLLMFQYRGDANPRHNIPEKPILNPIEGVLLTLGLGAALARPTRFPQAVWLAWFVVMLLPAILTIEAPQAYRSIGVIPAVYLLAGEGGSLLLAAASGKAWRVATVSILLGLLALGSASINLSRYFRIQVRIPLAWDAFEAEHHAVGQFLKPYGNRYDIWVNPLYFDYPIERFYLGAAFDYARFRSSEHLPVSPDRVHPDRQGLLYVLEPFQEGLYPLFHFLYAHSQLGVHRDPFGRPMFVHILVPRQDLGGAESARASRMGFLAAYYGNEHWAGGPRILRREPAIWFHTHWHEDILVHPFTADWAALLRIEEPGEYAFELVTSGPTTLSFDRSKIFETQTVDDPIPRRISVPASAGEHLLVVSYLEKSSRATITLSWQPPNGATEVIPMSVLRPMPPEEYARLRRTLPRPNMEAK